MQAELEHDACILAASIEAFHLVLHVKHGAHRVGRIVEGGHHCVAHRLDDEAVVARHPFGEISEVIAHQPVGGGVA